MNIVPTQLLRPIISSLSSSRTCLAGLCYNLTTLIDLVASRGLGLRFWAGNVLLQDRYLNQFQARKKAQVFRSGSLQRIHRIEEKYGIQGIWVYNSQMSTCQVLGSYSFPIRNGILGIADLLGMITQPSTEHCYYYNMLQALSSALSVLCLKEMSVFIYWFSHLNLLR